MNLFIDESGSFVFTVDPDSWCCVGAYSIPEGELFRMRAIIQNLKEDAGYHKTDEIKLHDLSESQFFRFLNALDQLGGTFHAVATDSSVNNTEIIKEHQMKQSDLIVEHIDKMKYEEGRRSVIALGKRVKSLSPQLYVQLQCQLQLMIGVLQSIITYYAQRNPRSLGQFKWSIDQKNLTKTKYEEAYEILGPPIMQSYSIKDPLILLEGADYSYMKKFEYTPETKPKYLSEVYGIDVKAGSEFNIGKILREDINFVDSKKSYGIQTVDLLISGLRRLLRREFTNNEVISEAMGKLMIQQKHNSFPVNMIGFSEGSMINGETVILLKILTANCRAFLFRKPMK